MKQKGTSDTSAQEAPRGEAEEGWPNWHLPAEELRMIFATVDRNGSIYTVYEAPYVLLRAYGLEGGGADGADGADGQETTPWFLVRRREALGLPDSVAGAFYASREQARAAGREHRDTGVWPSQGRGRRGLPERGTVS